MRKYREYKDEDVIESAKKVKSIAGLLRELNLKTAGGNYANIKRKLQFLKIDTTHWTGQAWNKNQQLKNWSDYTKAKSLKKHLIREKGHQCESCKNSEWMKEKIPIEIHHKDGDRTNNSIDNLELLCCNCHGLTNSWRKQKI